jgi:hypothetical protein
MVCPNREAPSIHWLGSLSIERQSASPAPREHSPAYPSGGAAAPRGVLRLGRSTHVRPPARFRQRVPTALSRGGETLESWHECCRGIGELIGNVNQLDCDDPADAGRERDRDQDRGQNGNDSARAQPLEKRYCGNQ